MRTHCFVTKTLPYIVKSCLDQNEVSPTTSLLAHENPKTVRCGKVYSKLCGTASASSNKANNAAKIVHYEDFLAIMGLNWSKIKIMSSEPMIISKVLAASENDQSKQMRIKYLTLDNRNQ